VKTYQQLIEEKKRREADALLAAFAPIPTAHDDPLPHNGTETSKAAAERERPAAEGHRLEIFECLALNPRGLTRLEIAERTGIKENTVNARAADLLKAGMAVEAGVRDGRKVLFHVVHAPRQQEAA
jgi:hypothetical protein